jgi:hypothetical protein
VSFTPAEDLDLRVQSGQTAPVTLSMETDYTPGDYVNWPEPWNVELALGADIAALQALAEQARQDGGDAEVLRSLLQDVLQLRRHMRSARADFPDRVEALADAGAWFDPEALAALRPQLEEAVCEAMGRRILSARRAEDRADAYFAVSLELGQLDLTPSCFSEEVRLAVARALVNTDQAENALVLTQRDEDGEVASAWRDVYFQGHLALVGNAIDDEYIDPLTRGIASLDAARAIHPEDPRLQEMADQFLPVIAAKVEALIGEDRELDAYQLTAAARENWAGHPAVEQASTAAANGLVEYGIRGLAEDNPVRANNAYVYGLRTFEGLPAWEEGVGRLQAARRDYELASFEAAVAEGRFEAAEEALEAAENYAEIDPERMAALQAQLLDAQWAAIDVSIANQRYEEAMQLANTLSEGEQAAEILGERRAQTYLGIAESIWDQYGLLAGLANRARISLAEEALERGREADPGKAGSLKTKFVLARWLFPAIIFLVVVVGGGIFIFRGQWRKRRKAKKLWHHGERLADQGKLGEAARFLEAAYEIAAIDDMAVTATGHDLRGEMVLRIASIQSKREREEQVEAWRREWKTLEEWERPISKDFDEALEGFRP